MNFQKELKLAHSKSKVQWWIILAIFGMVLAFTACQKDCNCPEDNPEVYPSLKVINDLDDYIRSITEVTLIGYSFGNLNIKPYGDSQTFILDKGMSGGYEDINVKVTYIRNSSVRSSRSIEINFNDGKTTTITLTGCDDSAACRGIYLE